jgi:hypothetical protein
MQQKSLIWGICELPILATVGTNAPPRRAWVRKSSGALGVSKRERQSINEHREDEIVLLVGEKTLLGKARS